MSIPPFFEAGDAKDELYQHIRDLPCFQDYKQKIENLWQLFCKLGLQDANYKQRTQAKNEHFHGVFWEMLFAKLLHEQGYPLTKLGSTGPDFSFEYQGKKIHIEATARRNNLEEELDLHTICASDDVQVSAPNRYGLISANYGPLTPFEKRIQSSFRHRLRSKMDAFNKYRERGIVQPDSYCFIALNWYEASTLIDICRAHINFSECFPYSKSPQTIHGVLYSTASINNIDKPLFFSPNPNIKVPDGLFSFCQPPSQFDA